MSALNAQTPLITAHHGKPPVAFPIYGNAYGSTAGNSQQKFYNASGSKPLFTFGGAPGVIGPSAPAESILADTPQNRAMSAGFQSMFQQGPDYPSVVDAADPRAMVYMRGAFYDPAFRYAHFRTRVPPAELCALVCMGGH